MRLVVAVLMAMAPVLTWANSTVEAVPPSVLFTIGTWSVTWMEILPVGIAIAGIAGLLAIRRQSRFL